jgi:hypothetical protein
MPSLAAPSGSRLRVSYFPCPVARCRDHNVHAYTLPSWIRRQWWYILRAGPERLMQGAAGL